MPPRLPDLSGVLERLRLRAIRDKTPIMYTMVCLSYRGYWKSRGRPSERGIRKDARAAIQWIAQRHAYGAQRGASDDITSASGSPGAGRYHVVLWGQSIGAGFATQLAADLASLPSASSSHALSLQPRIRAFVLETPFLSMRTMLETVYPQRWLPYRYLWPFLRTNLDMQVNLGVIAAAAEDSVQSTATGVVAASPASPSSLPRVLVLDAGDDELVPRQQPDRIVQCCEELGINVERKTVKGAVHTEALMRSEGKDAVAEFVHAEARRVVDEELG